MSCYDDFITFPDNINPQQVVDGKFWNLYHPMKFKPEPGEFPNIDKLMEHIFGEQKELGYDYLQQLYTNPQQKLPIIVLVSRERNTGKSTFMHFLHLWFGDNVTFNTNEDFGSQFNADWAGMLLICVNEALLSKREYSERIKNLSTARFYKIEAKSKDKIQQELSCKREQKQTCLHFAECSRQCSFGTILRGKEYKKMFYRPVDIQLEREHPSPFADIRVAPLTSSHFLDYCAKRYIDPEVAKAECRQVDYQLYGLMNSAIGFENDKGGWELRNPSTKICTCKAISTRRKQDGNTTVCVFEGFFDYLSFLTLMKPDVRHKCDYVILNSVL